jgi:hypothetical protein
MAKGETRRGLSVEAGIAIGLLLGMFIGLALGHMMLGMLFGIIFWRPCYSAAKRLGLTRP